LDCIISRLGEFKRLAQVVVSPTPPEGTRPADRLAEFSSQLFGCF
jgi:hypothetical protein